MKSLHTYMINELRLGSLKRSVTFDIDLSKSDHAAGRQTRHGTDDRNVISDDEIKEEINMATEKIIDALVYGKITCGDEKDGRFIIQDQNTDLNIVCFIDGDVKSDKLTIRVVTVIRTDNFWNTKKNYIIKI